jgi:hypothetical protein
MLKNILIAPIDHCDEEQEEGSQIQKSPPCVEERESKAAKADNEGLPPRPGDYKNRTKHHKPDKNSFSESSEVLNNQVNHLVIKPVVSYLHRIPCFSWRPGGGILAGAFVSWG